jgi:hypothetical protein
MMSRGDWREPRQTAARCPQGEPSVRRERINAEGWRGGNLELQISRSSERSESPSPGGREDEVVGYDRFSGVMT